ncbi:MAG: hypothetical protein K2X29_08650 [Candidatus Obscuribacterales bacterium]|nr:hypothetical protein [Candidatus Obscuribacterales bacterium]
MSDLDLFTTFADLHAKLAGNGISIILGGGLGLYLKQLYLIENPVRTLIEPEGWPQPRSTSDIDIFFPLEVLISFDDMKMVRSIIDGMHFEPIPGSEYWRFVLPENEVMIDLLTGPIEETVKSLLKSDSRRARPKGDLQLHAHPVPEALDLSDQLEQVALTGRPSNDLQYSSKINIPSPFTYLMMKVTAFGDQLDNEDKDLGRHHALDVYRIVAMMSETQFLETKSKFELHSSSEYVERVRGLIAECFAAEDGIGVLRMREHAFWGSNMRLPDFIGALKETIGL